MGGEHGGGLGWGGGDKEMRESTRLLTRRSEGQLPPPPSSLQPPHLISTQLTHREVGGVGVGGGEIDKDGAMKK